MRGQCLKTTENENKIYDKLSAFKTLREKWYTHL